MTSTTPASIAASLTKGRRRPDAFDRLFGERGIDKDVVRRALEARYPPTNALPRTYDDLFKQVLDRRGRPCRRLAVRDCLLEKGEGHG